jgi:hypothetical protein
LVGWLTRTVTTTNTTPVTTPVTKPLSPTTTITQPALPLPFSKRWVCIWRSFWNSARKHSWL